VIIEMTDDHRYTVNACLVPGVTTILGGVLGDPAGGWATEWHMERGSAAHALYALLGRGEDLALYDYDARLDGHVRCWREWAAAEKPEFVAVERRVASVRFRYAGTLDAIARMRGKLWLIDYKASATCRDALQMAAYALAWEEGGGERIQGLAAVQIDGERWRYGQQVRGAALYMATADWHAVRRAYEIKQGQ
jgi:hypothetical protein